MAIRVNPDFDLKGSGMKMGGGAKPFGLDAAIYLGAQDFQFRNDTAGDILIQAFAEGDNLYFAFYGTKDNRVVSAEGPFISNYKVVTKEPIVLETEDLPMLR